MVWKVFKRSLFWKLFFSNLLVIMVGLAVMFAAIQIAMPAGFTRHIDEMNLIMSEGGMPMTGGMGMGQRGLGAGPSSGRGMMGQQLFTLFNQAVSESLAAALAAAVIAAVAVSAFVSYHIVKPVRRMTLAAEHIAGGSYSDRVAEPPHKTEQDLDELGRLALRFNQMASNLENIETMRRQLIGDVAHELRTPLTTIKGSMEGLMDGVLPARPETFAQIEREADRLQRLVEDLQELSRVEGGAYRLNIHAVPVARLFEGVFHRLEKRYIEKGVRLVVITPAPGLPAVFVDEDRIEQVLMNLVANALQYTPEGGQVTLSACQAGQSVEITVHDTGIGIPAEHLPHVFDRFYRIDKSRSRLHGGSGIGLTIAKYLVEAHGGAIHAKSEGEGCGSSFVFTLPLVTNSL